MAQERNQQRSFTDRLRDLLETLEQALKPAPQAPQRIPVRNRPQNRH
jgi:hypothetical protein